MINDLETTPIYEIKPPDLQNNKDKLRAEIEKEKLKLKAKNELEKTKAEAKIQEKLAIEKQKMAINKHYEELKKQVKNYEYMAKRHICLHCGTDYANQENNFYRSANSDIWAYNNGFTGICRDCIRKMVEKYKEEYKSERIAAILMCRIIDIAFIPDLYYKTIEDVSEFKYSIYTRKLNGSKYRGKTFIDSILQPEFLMDAAEVSDDGIDKTWTTADKRNAMSIIEIAGYDPFEGYNSADKKALVNELIKYLDEDGIEDDHYKISQLVQLVNNNYQIKKVDALISKLNPAADMDRIIDLGSHKKGLVMNNDKIAKENGISVSNRANKGSGRSTLTYLMRDLRERDFKDAEANYYDNLLSANTQWAADVSMKAIKANTFFDENDMNDVFERQRHMVSKLQHENDIYHEEKRRLLLRVKQLEDYIREQNLSVPMDGDERDLEIEDNNENGGDVIA